MQSIKARNFCYQMDPLADLEDIFERGDHGGVNFVPCLKWVQRGVAKSEPEKVQLTEEELAAIIRETQSKLEDLEVEENDGEDEDDAKENIVDGGKIKEEPENSKEEEEEDVVKKYGLDTYDDDEEDTSAGLGLGGLVSFADTKSDPYMLKQDEEDDKSDEEDFKIKPTDNLLLVGHVEGNASILEVYVYNDVEDAFYIHHDILLPSFPLALEWLNFEPGDKARGNLVAIGSMEPVIEVWDLDLVDCLEPAFSLGKKAKKAKKKVNGVKPKVKGYGHKDAVLSLAWNKHAEHVLASGSVDQTVLIWDLSEGNIAATLKAHNEKIQALQWHPFEAQMLLTGCCDQVARTFDCRSEDSFKAWNVQGEVEKVLWNHFNPYTFLVGTDKGNVHMIDTRVDDKSIWTLNAHYEGINGMTLSSQCPDCLITGSSDKTVKVWDIANDQPACVQEKSVKIGMVHSLDSCQDAPFVVAIGGDNPSDNIKVFDIRESAAVRSRFGNRKLQNPLGFSSFGYETANDAEVETMEAEANAVVLNDRPIKEEPVATNSGGAIGKFKKKDKKKKIKKEL